MRKMIISWETYHWAECLSGLISREPKKFDIIIVCRDDERSICGCKKLCREAVYAQRADDLFNIGTALKVQKLMNLAQREDDVDPTKLVAQLQLHTVMGGIGEIYYDQTAHLLTLIAKEIGKKTGVKTYGFENMSLTLPAQRFVLSDEEFELKRKILDMMVGYPHEKPIPYRQEVLFK